MKLFLSILVPLLSMISMKKGRLKDDLIGAVKCQRNCHTEEASEISAITTETRNHRLILWPKRFR